MTPTILGRRLRARKTLLSVTTILAAGLAGPAIAQLAAPPPVRQTVDANGVDLFRGMINIDAPSVSMGATDPQGLNYHQLTRGQGWTDNLTATLNVIGSYVTVTFGGSSDNFAISGSTYTSTEGNGATLTFNSTTNVYTYTAADGTIAHFDKTKSGTYPFYATNGRITDLSRPSGQKLVYTYDALYYCSASKPGGLGDVCTAHLYAYRVHAVRNSYGYSVGYGYASDGSEFEPTIVPDSSQLSTWATPAGVTMRNLANSGGATAQESFTTTTVGGSTFYNITDPMSRTTKYRINSWTVLGITRPGSASEDVTITNASGRITGVTTAAGTTTYAFSDSGSTRTVTATDSGSHVSTYGFDIPSQRLTSFTDANGHTTSYTYDTAGRMTRTTYPEGNYTQITYDARGNVTQRRDVAKSGSGLADLVASASFDASCTIAAKCNKPNSVTDPRGNTTDYTYDTSTGNLLTVTRPVPSSGAVRPQTRYSYTSYQAYFDAAGGSSYAASGEPVSLLTGISTCQTAASCAGTANEVKKSVSYGPQAAGTGNNLLPVSASQGAGDGSLTATATSSYDSIGNLLTVDGPLAGTADTTRYRYDADRELVGVVSPDPDGAGSLKNRAQRTTFNAWGQVTKVENGTVNSQLDADWAAFAPLQAVETVLDAAGRPIVSKLTSGGTTYSLTQTSYDTTGRPQCVAVRMNPAVFGSLPSSACSLGTAGSYGSDRITRTTYDAAGQVTKVTSAYGTSDQADDVTATYTYNGLMQTMLDGENNKTTYVYDGFDRLSQTQFPVSTKGAGSSNSSNYEQLNYDANGNVTSRRVRDGRSILYTYDNLNRMTAENLPNTANNEFDLSYGYDNLDRITAANAANGYQGSFTWDALGRNLSESTNWYGTKSSTWDAAGRRTRLTWRDGFFVDYDYLATGEVSKVRENGATTGIGVLGTFGYDNLGRRTSLTRGNGTTTSYGYDAISRLSSLTQNLTGTANDLTLTFGYNPVSQIASTTRSNDVYAWTGHGSGTTSSTVNGLNQIATVGGVSVSYDAKGNLTNDGTSAFSFTAENRLATGPGTSLIHDPMGRLYGTLSATVLDYDGADLILEVDQPTGTQVKRRYVFGPGSNEPLVWYEGPGTSDRRFLHADERGSIIAVSDGAGNATAINRYDEYGVPQGPSGVGTLYGRFGYTGQAWLPEAGDYNYKARIYDPVLGRFMQTDPIGYGSGANLYAYVSGDPVNATDPSGTRKIWYTGSLNPGVPPVHYGCSGDCNFGNPSGPQLSYDPSVLRGDDGVTGGGDATLASTQNLLPLQNAAWSLTSHDYLVGPMFICVDSAACRGAIHEQFPSYVVPNSNEPVRDQQISPIYAIDGFPLTVGHVQTTFSEDGLSASNVTLSDHWLRYGQVDIANGLVGGSWYVAAHGYGTNLPGVGLLNQALGPGIFGGMLQSYVSVVRSRLTH